MSEDVDALRSRARALKETMDDPDADWHERSEAKNALEELTDHVVDRAQATGEPALQALAARMTMRVAEQLLGWGGPLWFELEPLWRRAAELGEASREPPGLEAASLARLSLGERLVDPGWDEGEGGGPLDLERGRRELSEAVRLGRGTGTMTGWTVALRAGWLHAEVAEDEDEAWTAEGLREGVEETMEIARSALGAEEVEELGAWFEEGRSEGRWERVDLS